MLLLQNPNVEERKKRLNIYERALQYAWLYTNTSCIFNICSRKKQHVIVSGWTELVCACFSSYSHSVCEQTILKVWLNRIHKAKYILTLKDDIKGMRLAPSLHLWLVAKHHLRYTSIIKMFSLYYNSFLYNCNPSKLFNCPSLQKAARPF